MDSPDGVDHSSDELCRRSRSSPLEHLVYPDVTDCRNYFYCANGQAHRATCNQGLYYNQQLQSCDVDRTQRCNTYRVTNEELSTSSFSPTTYSTLVTGFVDTPPSADLPEAVTHLRQHQPDGSYRPVYDHTGGQPEWQPQQQQPTPTVMLEDRIRKVLQQQQRQQQVRDEVPLPNHVTVHQQLQQYPHQLTTVSAEWQPQDSTQRSDEGGEVTAANWHKEHLLITGEELCRTRGDGAFSHPHDCRGYVICTSSGRQAFPGQCPERLVFNEVIRSCDFDVNDRCASSTPANNGHRPDADPTRQPQLSISSLENEVGSAISGSSVRNVLNASNARQAASSRKIRSRLPVAIDGAMTSLLASLQQEAELSARVNRSNVSNRPFGSVQQFLRAKPLARQLGLSAFILTSVTRDLISELGLSADEALSILSNLDSPLPSNSNPIAADDPTSRRPDPGTCPWPTYRCDVTRKYRSFDGSCNNLIRPIRGRSFTPFARYLPAEYADGVQAIRSKSSDPNRSPLPSARLVSRTIAEDRDLPHHIQSLWLMVWGQFIDHDLSLTALSKDVVDPSGYGQTVDIVCGTDGCASDRDECQPIVVPPTDPDFRGKICLEFVRSQAVPNINCTMAAREQLNQLTSYVDASMVYGSTKEEADTLRDFTRSDRGQLRYSSNPNNGTFKYLLPSTDKTLKQCREFDATHPCFLAGDDRVNEQSVLAVVHTLWLREHNRIETELHRINPSWDGETLYQETRRIVGAMMQHITYNEFLPVVLGQENLEKYDLRLETGSKYYDGYNSSVDASVKNVFATAAMRFGHTFLPSSISRVDSNYKRVPGSQTSLSQMLNRPRHLYITMNGGIDSLVRGMLDQPIQSYDRFVTAEVTVHLFAEKPPNGLGTDLVSLNIQRGRDHGIPGYNKWRRFCGLSTAVSFDTLEDIVDPAVRQKFRVLYRDVDDIDLFPAAIAERAVNGSLVGPTFACLLSQQFQDLRRGDRFWYENPGPFQFTEDQLIELRKVTLAKLICQNSDYMDTIQPNVMQLPFREAYPTNRYNAKSGLSPDWFSQLWTSDFNARVKCDSECLQSMDLTKWKVDNS